MSTVPTPSENEAGWKTYLKGMSFLLPGIVLWLFACVFFVPKLQELWMEVGGAGREQRWILDFVLFVARYGPFFAGAGLGAVLLCELPAGLASRYRRRLLGVCVFLLNSTILAWLWFLCLAALLIAPALLPHK